MLIPLRRILRLLILLRLLWVTRWVMRRRITGLVRLLLVAHLRILLLRPIVWLCRAVSPISRDGSRVRPDRAVKDQVQQANNSTGDPGTEQREDHTVGNPFVFFPLIGNALDGGG